MSSVAPVPAHSSAADAAAPPGQPTGQLPGQPPGPPHGPQGGLQRRVLGVLVASQVLGGVGASLGVAVGGPLGAALAGTTTLAGLPGTATVLGAALAAVPLARLTARRGRRPGLAAGYLVGALGGAVVVLAAAAGSFLLLLAGTMLLGAATAAGLQARYAATDLAEPGHRARALSAVVWATTVGAVLGPNLSDPAGGIARSAGLPVLAGPFVWSAMTFAAAAVLLAALLRPDPLLRARALRPLTEPPAQRLPVRAALALVVRSPVARMGLAGMAVGHAVMVAVMTMTPVHMLTGGATLAGVGVVISAHVAGMYALSPLTGYLVDRLGGRPVVVLGGVVLLLAVGVVATASPHADLVLALGLFLLGLGWSATLVAGSTLLTEGVPLPARPSVQGVADLVMGLAGASAGAAAGVVMGLAGYPVLALAAGATVLPLLLVVLTGSAYVPRPRRWPGKR